MLTRSVLSPNITVWKKPQWFKHHFQTTSFLPLFNPPCIDKILSIWLKTQNSRSINYPVWFNSEWSGIIHQMSKYQDAWREIRLIEECVVWIQENIPSPKNTLLIWLFTFNMAILIFNWTEIRLFVPMIMERFSLARQLVSRITRFLFSKMAKKRQKQLRITDNSVFYGLSNQIRIRTRQKHGRPDLFSRLVFQNTFIEKIISGNFLLLKGYTCMTICVVV